MKIDTSPGRTPEETKRKAQQIRTAALAPSDPSPQDLKVAAKASNMERSSSEEAEDSENGSRSDETQYSGEITSSRQLVATGFLDSQSSETNSDDSTPASLSFAIASGTRSGTSSD